MFNSLPNTNSKITDCFFSENKQNSYCNKNLKLLVYITVVKLVNLSIGSITCHFFRERLEFLWVMMVIIQFTG